MVKYLLAAVFALLPLTASAQVTAIYINYAITSGTSVVNRPAGAYLRYICATAADLPTANVIDGDRAFTSDTARIYARTGGAWVISGADTPASSLLTTSQTASLPIGAVTDGQVLQRVGGNIVGVTIAGGGDMLKSENLSGLANYATARTNLGLGNVDNTSDANKPVSNATQTALDAKQATAQKGAANGYASLDALGLVPVAQLPGLPAAWGAITGVLSAQADLQTALDGKQASGSYATGTGSANGTNTGDQTSIVGITGSLAEFNSALTGADFATGGGTATGTNTGDQTTVSGNAGTATTLQTPRNINGVPFNGSANITVTAAADTLSGTTLAALSGVNLTNLDASDLASGTVPTARMGSGTANSTTFLRGDSTWAAPPGAPTYVVTVADTTNATTAYANITGMVIPVLASTRYRISCVFPYDANATTTGIGIGWTGPASPTLTRGLMVSPITTATPGSTVSVGNDTGAVTTASVATTNNVATFEGIWSNGANAGNIQMRVKSEVAIANAIIVRTGAVCSAAVY